MRTGEIPIFLGGKPRGFVAPPPGGGGGGGGGGTPGSIVIVESDFGVNVTPPALNLTTSGFDDYIVYRGNGDYTLIRKATTPGGTTPVTNIYPQQGAYGDVNGPYLLNGATFFGQDLAVVGIPFPNDSWTDGVDQDGNVSSSTRNGGGGEAMRIEYSGTGPVDPRGGILLFPADAGTHTASILVYAYSTDDPVFSAVQLQCNFEGLGTTTIKTIPISGGNVTFTRYDITYTGFSTSHWLYVYMMASLDGGRDEPPNAHWGIAWAGYTAGAITPPPDSGGILLDETWAGASGTALPTGWINTDGQAYQRGDGSMAFYGPGFAVHDLGVTDFVLTGIIWSDQNYDGFMFRSNAAGSNYSWVFWDGGGTNKLRYIEHSGADVTDVVGTNAIFPVNNWYDIKISVVGTALVVSQRTTGSIPWTVEITIPMTINLSNTFIGVKTLVGGGAWGHLVLTKP